MISSTQPEDAESIDSVALIAEKNMTAGFRKLASFR